MSMMVICSSSRCTTLDAPRATIRFRYGRERDMRERHERDVEREMEGGRERH